jgi:hypothetical protein
VKPPEYYRGREQTYLKHFFLERYLERVTYNIGSFQNEFVYVDGFSGPWKSGDEPLDDTSFMIAIKKLRQVREGLGKIGRTPKIRCLFVEKDPESYRALEAAVRHVTDIQVQPLNGEFEQSIPEVLKFVAKAFSLVFIQRLRAASVISRARSALTTRPCRYDSSAASMPASSSGDSAGASSSIGSTR